MIGAKREAIDKAEDRDLFNKAMAKNWFGCAKALHVVHTMEDAHRLTKQQDLGFPTIIRPSVLPWVVVAVVLLITKKNLWRFVSVGLICHRPMSYYSMSLLLGWKEYEMEVVRDHKDNCIIICAIENFDPMGVHTGDSITVAPAQTLTDKEYQIMRDASISCVCSEIGVETGGSNVQFAY